MRLNILIIEDDPIDLISIKAKIKELNHYEPVVVSHAANVESLLQEIKPQLIISDIYYENKPLGLGLIEICKSHNIPLILITADTRFDTYKLANKQDRVAYMVKPFHHFTLQTCIDMVMADSHTTMPGDDKYIFVNDYHNKKVKLNYRDILFLESAGNSCYIQCVKNRYMVRISLVKLSAELRDDHFVQAHKSFIVNREYINKISNGSLTVEQQEIPIGRKFRKDLLEVLHFIKK